MDGRWPEFPPAAVLLDMDTLPDPTDFYQAWTRRLMNDKPDTLDAIDKAIKAYDEYFTAAKKKMPAGEAHHQAMRYAIESITALSNQGEGASCNVCGEVYQVVGAAMFGEPGECVAYSQDDVERVLDNLSASACGEPIPHESLLPFGRGQNTDAEADRRDAERLDYMVHRGANIDCYKGAWTEATVYRVTAFGSILTEWHDTYRDAIDAAIAATQEQT